MTFVTQIAKNLQPSLKRGSQLHCLFPVSPQSFIDNQSTLNVYVPLETLSTSPSYFSLQHFHMS